MGRISLACVTTNAFIVSRQSKCYSLKISVTKLILVVAFSTRTCSLIVGVNTKVTNSNYSMEKELFLGALVQLLTRGLLLNLTTNHIRWLHIVILGLLYCLTFTLHQGYPILVVILAG